MHGDPGQVVIIQPRAGQLLVRQIEAQRLDQVQSATGVGRKTNDVAGVGGNFGLVENDLEHRNRITEERLGREAGTVAQAGVGVRATTRLVTRLAP